VLKPEIHANAVSRIQIPLEGKLVTFEVLAAVIRFWGVTPCTLALRLLLTCTAFSITPKM
jgi:hypothetical protein